MISGHLEFEVTIMDPKILEVENVSFKHKLDSYERTNCSKEF